MNEYTHTPTWAVKFRNNSQGEPPQLPEPLWPPPPPPPHEAPPILVDQPLAREPPFADRPGGGPRDFGAPHNSDVTAVPGLASPSPILIGSLFWGLVNALEAGIGGLKLHVDELRLNGWTMSAPEPGGLLLGFMLNSSLSLMVAIDNDERTTEPGVILGSSSIDFIWLPCEKRKKKHGKYFNPTENHVKTL